MRTAGILIIESCLRSFPQYTHLRTTTALEKKADAMAQAQKIRDAHTEAITEEDAANGETTAAENSAADKKKADKAVAEKAAKEQAADKAGELAETLVPEHLKDEKPSFGS